MSNGKHDVVCVHTVGPPVHVTIDKSAGGVGFTLEGGKGSIHGDRPLLINRIYAGKPVKNLHLKLMHGVLCQRWNRIR